MSNQNLKISLSFNAETGELTGKLKSTEADFKSFGDTAQTQTKKGTDGFKGMESSISSLKRGAAGIIGAIGLHQLSSKIIQTTAEFQKLEASLVTVTGSSAAANEMFEEITDFAKSTPYQLTEVTDAFIKMQALGLDPSEKAMTSYGDTASAMGKSLNQMIEAVADASTGEFERLKEFGIKARQQGDEVSFTFGGVTTTVGKNADEIQGYLIGLGETQFAGGMARQMDTIGGKLSNLSDGWDKAFNAIGESNSGVISTTIDGLGSLAEAVRRVFTETDKLRAESDKLRVSLFAKQDTDYINIYRDGVDSALSSIKILTLQIEPFQKSAWAREQIDLYRNEITQTQTQVEVLKDKLFSLGSAARGELIDNSFNFEHVEFQMKEGFATREKFEADNAKVKSKLLAREFELTASVGDQRSAILKTLDQENAKIQTRIWLAEDLQKVTKKQKKEDDSWFNEGFKNAGTDFKFLDQESEQRLKEEERAALKLQSQIDKLTLSSSNFGEAWVRTGNQIIDAMSSVGQVLEKANSKESAYAEDALKIQSLRYENDAHYAKDSKKWKDNEAKLTKDQVKLEEARTKNSLQGSMAMLDASVAMFDEGSVAQEAAHKASLAFHAIEMAMNIEKAISAATVAVAEQGKGDPYTAWARIGSMSVMMASLLSQIGGSFGGASGSAPQLSVVNAPDGSPLGSTDPSESIANAFEFYDDIQADQYNELRDINRGMQDLNSNLTGVVSSLYRTGDLAQISAIAESFNSKSTGSSGFLGNIISSIFGGGTTRSVVDYGLAATSFQLGGEADLRGYDRVKKKTDGGWFGSSKTSYYDIYSDISGESERLFNLVFENLRDTTVALGDSLGMSIADQVDDFTINLGKISTNGKTGEEVEQALTEAISGQADRIAYNFFGGLIDDYGKLSEGAYETISRLIGEKAVIADVLDMTNLSIVGDAIELSQALIDIAGGLDELSDAAANYYDAFFSESEKALRNQEYLTEALAQQNLLLPIAKDGYRDLVESLDLGTEAGQEQYVALMNLSETAADYYDYLNSAQQESFDLQIGLIQTTISEYQILKNALQGSFDSITGSVVAYSMKYMTAQSTISSALGDARNGNLPALDSIQSALSVVGQNSTANYATFADYQRDQMVTASMLDELMGYTDAAITVEDQMLAELQAQTDALNNLNVVNVVNVVSVGVDGSHATGLSNVPFDGYRAELHKDEAIIDARTMSGMRKYGISTSSNNNADLIVEIKALRKEVVVMREQLYGANIAIATSAGKTSRMLDKWDVDGQPEVRVL
ncbi:MAG: hypothetical protein GXO35_07565 [Gammaproteobacteria bacterium]|nr:hypothetical protein [Gammaproteobacteria bacterium]